MAHIPSKQFVKAVKECRQNKGDSWQYSQKFGRGWELQICGVNTWYLFHYDTLILVCNESAKVCRPFYGYSASDRDGINSLTRILFGKCVAYISCGELFVDGVE